MSNATVKPATAKQLRYLRALANKTGTTFTQPATSREASREIARMRRLTPRVDAPTGRDAEARYATAPVQEEIAGYGVDAHWRHTSPPKQRNGTPRSSPPESPAPHRRVKATVLATHESDGAPRRVLSIPVGSGRLIVDRPTAGGEARLLARLDPDEPPENATLVARMYVADPRRPRCRPVTPADLEPSSAEQGNNTSGIAWQAPLIVGIGARFQIQTVRADRGTSLRWTEQQDGDDSATQTVSLRHVLGRVESYQPAVAMTHAAIRAHENSETSTATLKSELARLQASPIVLNRRLREHVQRATDTNGVTMSAIAMRCGRIKRDHNGRESGETSWLARRIGTAPEAGAPRPTPWIHSDVLALIAREGLGISPAEVELH
ncbi:MAG: hypothetical protein ACLQBB_03835 [Solirubrobacteraceae bacterium]